MMGIYEHTLGDQGELPIPAAFAGELRGGVLCGWPSPDGGPVLCITTADRLESGRICPPPPGMTGIPLTGSTAVLPPAFRALLGSREVVLVGLLDLFEVWPREAWERESRLSFDQDPIAAMMEEIAF